MELEHLRKICSSYMALFTAYRQRVTVPTSLALHSELEWFLVDQPILPTLLTAHALFASLNIYRLTRGTQFWLKSLVLTIFAAFGGSTLASVLCAKPAPLFTHSSNHMLLYVTLAWYAVNHYAIVRRLLQIRAVAAVLSFTAMAAKSRSIFNFIDEHHARFPGAVAGAIALGGLSGSGGSLFVTLERIVQQGFSAAGELSAPGWGFKSAYIAAASYYIATDPHMILRSSTSSIKYAVHPRAARFWIALFLCAHAAIETLVGRHINPVYVLEQLFFSLTGVRKHSGTVDTDGADGVARRETAATVQRAWTAYDGKQRKGVSKRKGFRLQAES